ncbi:MAG: L-threonine 3-dehydrogenase [Pirellulales bacterium]|nr:L-threonine 3-dehydrogenase [Pirellulales bacterium]
MKALVKKHRERGLWLDDVPKPAVGPHDVLVRIRKTAICGTDLHIFKWDDWAQRTIPVPMTVGHEYMGVVEEIGAEVTVVQPGDRVTGEGHLTCGICRNCQAGRRHLCRQAIGVGIDRPGGFAEYLSLPESNIFKLPGDVGDELAAIFDPLGNAVHTTLSFDLVGEDVLITGAGPIGVMATAIAIHAGARYVVVTDVNDYRLQLASACGATRTVNPQREDLKDVIPELGMTEGFDVGLEMSGNGSAFRSMISTMIHGGSIAMLGIFPGPETIDWSDVIFKGLQIKGIYGREMFETWYKMTAMIQSGLDVTPAITHRMLADDFQQAFDIMQNGHAGKVILDWS